MFNVAKEYQLFFRAKDTNRTPCRLPECPLGQSVHALTGPHWATHVRGSTEGVPRCAGRTTARSPSCCPRDKSLAGRMPTGGGELIWTMEFKDDGWDSAVAGARGWAVRE